MPGSNSFMYSCPICGEQIVDSDPSVPMQGDPSVMPPDVLPMLRQCRVKGGEFRVARIGGQWIARTGPWTVRPA